MSDPHNSQARIGRADAPDETIGCGLLVTPRHVVTCAHVVARALGAEATAAEAPAGRIPVDLPLLARPFRTTGRCIRWLQLRENQDKAPEDIAVLELAEEVPPEAEPAPLLSLEPKEYIDLPVHCFGFPAGIDEGTHRHGTCRGENTLGWVQLDVERGLVEGGFSGTGAWDPNQGAAVGLVVAARSAEQTALLIPVRTLFAAWPELDSAWRPRNPYKGLAAFGAADRADFFGRADLVPRLLDRVQDERLITLIGPSGSGKSSLIGAGLLPELAERGGWRCLVIRPGADPFDALADRLMPREGLTLAQRTEERRRLGELLADLPAGPVRVLREHLADSPDTALLLVVDQFEELFTNVQPAAPEKARAFVAALEALRDSDLPVHLLIGMRADFMGRAMEGPAAPFVQPSHQFQVAPLEGEALRAAVEGPAGALGVRFAPGLVEAILVELADQPGRLPLLQFALNRLWEEQRGRGIDAAALACIGGVRRALSDYADGVIDALAEAERTRARRILVQLVRPPEREDEAATRQVASFRRIPEQDQDLLPELVQSRLIVTSHGPGDEPMAEIAHEALIREWGRLGTWVAEDRSFRLWQEGLRSRMADWIAHDRHAGYLLAGPPLAEAEGWLTAKSANLSVDDSNYIRASRRRTRRRGRAVQGTVAAVILVLAAFGAVAWWQWQRALVQESEALAAAEAAELAKEHAQTEAARAEKAAARATLARSSAERLIGYMTFDLRKKLQPIGRLDLLRDAQQRVDAYYELLGVLEDNPEVMRQRAVNLFNSGDLQASLGDLAAADRLYAEGAQILTRLAGDDPSNAGWQRDLSVSLNKVGDIQAAQGDLAGALSAYQASQAIRERLAGDDPSNAGWQRDLVVSLWKLSEEGLAPPESARGYLERALEILEALDAAGRLHGEHRGWPDRIRQRLQSLDAPGN